MPLKRFILSILLVVGVLPCVMAQASFNIVSPRNVVAGRNFNITFRLSDGDANPPAAPQLEHCTLLYGPSVSTMQSTQIVNGRMTSTSSVDFSFVYRADSPGDVNVPSVTVNCDGKALKSRAASFKILPPDNTSSSGQSSVPQQGGASAQSSPDVDMNINSNDLIVRVSFSKSSVYEQEPVVATIKVYTKYDISSFLVQAQPEFEGFLSEELPTSQEVGLEHFNGQNYHTVVLKKLLLYPQKAGKLAVNTGKYDVTIVKYETVNMGFFRTQRPVERQITTSSNAASLTVKALPEPRPAGFNGAVGEFDVHTAIEPEILRTNEAAVYSYIIKGRGNIKYLNEPSVQFPAGIDTYTPKNEINANLVGGGTNMSGTFEANFTFVPQEVGNFVIEGQPFVYFNPESGQYKTIEVADSPIKVLRGNSVAAAAPQTAIDKTIDDILHIKVSSQDEQRHSVGYVFGSTIYWLAYIIAVLFLVAVVFVYRRHIRLKADVVGQRLAKASRVATKRLKTARMFMDKHENEKFYASLASALWGYISDKLSIAPSQLTRDNVEAKLNEYGLDEAGIHNVIDVLDRCEMARFTPTSDSDVAELYKLAATAINQIENVKKR